MGRNWDIRDLLFEYNIIFPEWLRKEYFQLMRGERGALCHEIQARKSGPNHNNMRNMHFSWKIKKRADCVVFWRNLHFCCGNLYLPSDRKKSVFWMFRQSEDVPPLSPFTVPEFTSFFLQSPWKPELKENTVLSWCLEGQILWGRKRQEKEWGWGCIILREEVACSKRGLGPLTGRHIREDCREKENFRVRYHTKGKVEAYFPLYEFYLKKKN